MPNKNHSQVEMLIQTQADPHTYMSRSASI